MSALSIEETVHIGAAPEAVWKLLVDPRSWRHWWPGCLEAETVDRKTLHEGSIFLLRVKLGWLSTKLRPKVNAATPPRILAWSAASAGISQRHAFYLDARPNGTFTRQQQSLDGPGLLLFRLLRLDNATRRMLQANLKGLKRMAERGG